MTGVRPTRLGWRATPAGIWALGFGQLFMDVSSELIHSVLPLLMITTLGASHGHGGRGRRGR